MSTSKNDDYAARANIRDFIEYGILNDFNRGSETFPIILREYRQNGEDKGATELQVHIQKRNQHDGVVLFVDDGAGMEKVNVAKFHSAYDNVKETIEAKERGEEEDRGGQFNTGRLSAFSLCTTLRVYTCTETIGFDNMVEFDLTVEKLRLCINEVFAGKDGKKYLPPYTPVPKPEWVKKLLPGTGTIIKLEGITDWGLVSEKKDLVNQLPRFMFPKNIRTISFNKKPLVAPEATGEVLEIKSEHPVLGKIEGSFCLKNTPSTTRNNSQILVGGRDPLISFPDLVEDYISLDQRYKLSDWCSHRNIDGYLSFSKINKFRSSEGFGKLVGNFRHSEFLKAFLDWSHTELREQLENFFGALEEQALDARKTEDLNFIVSEINGLFPNDLIGGYDEEGEGKTPPVPPTPGPKTPRGPYTKRDEDTFHITPQRGTIYQGEHITLTAKGAEGKVEWSISEGASKYYSVEEGINEHDESTFKFTCFASATAGIYKVIATTDDDYAEGIVKVLAKKPKNRLIKIEDQYYLLHAAATTDPMVGSSKTQQIEDNGIKTYKLFVNLEHELLGKKPIREKLLYMWPSIIQEHLSKQKDMFSMKAPEAVGRSVELINKFFFK